MTRRRLAVALLALAPIMTTGCGYNRIQQLDERANSAQSSIEVQLQRRADLIPNLVSTVKGYAQHEEKVFSDIANARAALLGAVKGGDPEQMATANAQVTGALGRLLVLQEAYPNLKADQQFLNLQAELSGTENRIAVSRTDYNEAVNDYNATIRTFPTALTAKVTGAKPRKYFTAAPGTTEAPKVDFSTPTTGGAPTGGAAPGRP
jgi:LemA protein